MCDLKRDDMKRSLYERLYFNGPLSSAFKRREVPRKASKILVVAHSYGAPNLVNLLKVEETARQRVTAVAFTDAKPELGVITGDTKSQYGARNVFECWQLHKISNKMKWYEMASQLRKPRRSLEFFQDFRL